jgi:hypothetical protein
MPYGFMALDIWISSMTSLQQVLGLGENLEIYQALLNDSLVESIFYNQHSTFCLAATKLEIINNARA